MDEARKLDIAQIAASEYARRPSDNYSSETFGKQVAQVFKDAYEALGDKQEKPPTFADYAKVTTGYLKQDTAAAWKDLEAEKVAKYNEKVKASEEKIAKQLSSDEPSWTRSPTKTGVYFTNNSFDSMQARWVLVVGGTVHWFGALGASTIKDSGITRFYGPMKAPE